MRLNRSLIVIFMTLTSACSTIAKWGAEPTDPVTQAALDSRRHPSSISKSDFAGSEMGEEMDAQIHQALRLGELTLGMEKDDVLSVWGQPRAVESAGDPQVGNQRWIYLNGLSENWSIGPKRIVYFEAGRVSGWEIR